MTRKDWELLNTRVVGQHGLKLPSSFEADACYSCPTNMEQTCTSAAGFKNHVIGTHILIESNDLPPGHTIVIYADIRHTMNKKIKVKIDNVLRHRIITSCDDAHGKQGSSTKVNPALCLYVGAYLPCVIDNKSLNDRVQRGNWTLCRLVSIKIKNHPSTHKWENIIWK